MKNQKPSGGFARRLASVATAAALVLGGTLVAAGPASAVEGVGNIEGTQGTLTIHKFERSSANGQTVGTGLEQAVSGTPLNDVTFSIERVGNFDLKTVAGWDSVEDITTAPDPIAEATVAGLTAVASVTTAGSGTVQETLPFGLYLVTETASPSTVTEAAEPFLVSVPFATGPTGTPANTWIYDVHVYPKNAVTALAKTETTTAADITAGADLARWSIAAKVPVLSSGTISDFVLNDVIPAELAFVTDAAAATLGIPGATVTAVQSNGTTNVPLVAGTDYNVTPNPAAGSTLTVTFTGAGLTKLSTQAPGGTVTFTALTRVVGEELPTDGLITNTATSSINGASGNSSQATATFGELQVFSYVVGTTTPLAGAVYELRDADGNPVRVNGETQWTSDSDGMLLIPSLRPDDYTLVIVSAPAGFQMPADTEVPVEVTAGVADAAVLKNYAEVPFGQVPAWALPLTGGDGALWFGVGGAALLTLALGAAVLVAGRRRHATPQA